MFKKIKIPDDKRIFVVGDIHANWDKLKKAMTEVNFNTETDVLIGVGDLIDKGSNSEGILEFIDQPWFITTLGNHDTSLLGYEGDKRFEAIRVKALYHLWYNTFDEKYQEMILNYLKKLPIAIEVEYREKRYGFIHAGLNENETWDQLKSNLINLDSNTYLNEDVVNYLWLTKPANKANMFYKNEVYKTVYDQEYIENVINSYHVRGIDYVLCGHTIVPCALRMANRVYLNLDIVKKEVDFKLIQLIPEEINAIPSVNHFEN